MTISSQILSKLDLARLILLLCTRFVHIKSRINRNCDRIFLYVGPNEYALDYCIYVATPLMTTTCTLNEPSHEILVLFS